MKVNKCKLCGEEIPPKKTYCAECLKLRNQQYSEEQKRKKKLAALKKKIVSSSLVDDVREAKRLGISYGQLKARQYSERMREWWE